MVDVGPPRDLALLAIKSLGLLDQRIFWGDDTRRARNVNEQKLEVRDEPEYTEDVEQNYWNPKSCVN
tara:strand:+ start:412 stop:612 length:201 start_codon:yes stop_codon:yes gene_type:complete